MPHHSEHGQSRWLEENIFNGKVCGTFFEAGALDGKYDSNSLYFEEDRGWTGALAEANPVMAEFVRRNRPNCHFAAAALWDVAGEEISFEQFDILQGWSGAIETYGEDDWRKANCTVATSYRHKILVPTITLNQVLIDAGITRLDYLSLDLEGAELRVLSAFDFARFPVDILGVEDNSGRNNALRELLLSKNFDFLVRIGSDDIWRRHG